MEFYRSIASSCSNLCPFQFPTGWNSTQIFNFFSLSIKSFNSQRDGILPGRGDRFLRHYERFQFPTGWNSTIAMMIDPEKFNVFQFPTGWNSTYKPSAYRQAYKVSIPNGMEFYTMSRLALLIWKGSFNSQRDGILHGVLESMTAVGIRFQFPTGWNSTDMR